MTTPIVVQEVRSPKRDSAGSSLPISGKLVYLFWS